MRVLATIAFSFAVALLLSLFVLPTEWLLLFCCAAAVLSLLGLLFKGYIRLRIIIILISFSIGFGWSFFYSELHISRVSFLHDQTAEVTAVISEYPVARTRGYRVDAKIQQDGIPAVNVRLYYSGQIDVRPGDVIKFTARFRNTRENDNGDRLDFLTSRGIFLSGYVTGSIDILSQNGSLLYLPRIVSRHISDKIGDIFPSDVAPFMQALLTGNRAELNTDIATNSALTGSGIIHVVSLSGMHVAFLMGFLGLLIRDRRLYAFCGLPLLLFFMAMAGFTPAVTRAGIMQAFLICAPIFKRESDSITSLSAALLLLLIINPYSIASVGLQLSFTATLGIMLVSPLINNKLIKPIRAWEMYKQKVPKRMLLYVVSGFSTTIGALIFTFPLTAIHFGYVSLIAPLTNVLTLWAISIVFPLGLIASLLAFLHNYLSIIIVFPVTALVRYVLATARFLSSAAYSTIYTSNLLIMFWLAYVYVLFITLPLLKARLKQYLLPVCSSILLLCILLILIPQAQDFGTTSLTVLDVGQGQSVALISEGHTIVIDCGSISRNNAGSITHEYLLGRGKTVIDLLIITHFHADHVNGIEFLLSRMPVTALAIPDPENFFLAEDILNLARRRGTDIIYVTQALDIDFGSLNIMIYPPLGSISENERGLAILSIGSINALITGDMNASSERALLRYAVIPELDVLIVGHHGSRHSTAQELLDVTMPKIAIIPVGRNSFGHPTAEVIDRLELIGSTVYRTDHMGHITVNVR